MVTNWIFVIVMILLAILAYFIGLKRGISGSQHLYDDGWLAAEEYFKRFPELVQDIDKMLDDLSQEQQKNEKARGFVAQLDELFGDDDENARSSPKEAPETTQNGKMNGNTTEK